MGLSLLEESLAALRVVLLRRDAEGLLPLVAIEILDFIAAV
jgi:hypothetical protein